MQVGDVVRKPKGYEFYGTVQATFRNRSGIERIVVESIVIPGLLHIFGPEQMEIVTGEAINLLRQQLPLNLGVEPRT